MQHAKHAIRMYWYRSVGMYDTNLPHVFHFHLHRYMNYRTTTQEGKALNMAWVKRVKHGRRIYSRELCIRSIPVPLPQCYHHKTNHKKWSKKPKHVWCQFELWQWWLQTGSKRSHAAIAACSTSRRKSDGKSEHTSTKINSGSNHRLRWINAGNRRWTFHYIRKPNEITKLWLIFPFTKLTASPSQCRRLKKCFQVHLSECFVSQ